MEVRAIVEAYTNLSQLERHAPGRAEAEEGRPDDLKSEVGPQRVQARTAGGEASGLRLAQAQSLAAEVAGALRADPETFLGERLYNVSELKFIGPRYV